MHTRELDDRNRLLINAASGAIERSYSPYSRFRVGAAVLLADGNIVTGANIENAAFPQCLCAEQVALSQKEMRFPDVAITALTVVAAKGENNLLLPVTPCGACRQVLVEFEARQQSKIAIILQIDDDNWIEVPSAASLLPYSFLSTNLDR